ncbi:MAG: hypothetical protein SFX18_11525 [Pirellulales bacterium]|nr:hypothetical protein [Pirellulales bacterium]
MSTAQVQSLDALHEFRAALIIFQSTARQALEMLETEARQGVDWICKEQPRRWKSENRKAWDGLGVAKDNLRQARIQRQLSDHIPDCTDEKKALARAEQRLKTTEQKLAAVQHWGREAQHAWNEFQARFAQTISLLDGDLPRAIAQLQKIIAQVEDYLAVRAPDIPPVAAVDASQDAQIPPPPATSSAITQVPADQSSREPVAAESSNS